MSMQPQNASGGLAVPVSLAAAEDCPLSTFTLLLRNLRLLDLDLLPDWPGLTEATFAANDDLRQKSKGRYKRAEWLLYRLFECWDLDWATNHLAIYFPPLETLQSIKLRSTAFLLLEEMKRDGTLPRGCPLRKSLLDDCVGPKFEELLLAMSTIALQKQMRIKRQHSHQALELATLQELDDSKTGPIDSLILVYSSSIRERLSQKHTLRDRYATLRDELGVRDEYFKLLESCNNAALSEYNNTMIDSGIDREDLKRRLRNSYNIDKIWLNVSISGEINGDRDALTEADRFEDLWTRACAGEAQQLDLPNTMSVTTCLDSMATAQTQRVHKWRGFQNQVSRRNGELVSTMSPVSSPRKTPRRPLQSSPSKSNRRKLSDTQYTPLAAKQVGRRTSSPRKPPRQPCAADNVTHDVGATQAASLKLERALFTQRSSEQDPSPRSVARDAKDAVPDTVPDNTGNTGLESAHNSREAADKVDHDDLQSSSLVTPRPSLAQRTRNSMAFTSNHRPRHSEDPTSPMDAATPLTSKANDDHVASITEGMAQVSLAERAQQSMARLQRSSSTKQPLRTTSHRRSKSHQLTRKPAFPVNPFGNSPSEEGTRLKGPDLSVSPDRDLGNASSPVRHGQGVLDAVDVHVEQQDPLNIFKPRHRLRMSPPGGSPVSAETAHGHA